MNILPLIVLLVPILNYNCTNLFPFEHSTCYFHFTNATDCNSFDFNYCTWQRCTLQQQRANSNYCQTYETANSTNWQTCTATCCQSNVSYARNWDAVYQCQAAINQNYYGTTVLSGVLLGVVILMVVLASCCFCYCCRTGYLGCCCRAVKDMIKTLLCCQCLRGRQVGSVDHDVSQQGISGQNQSNQAVYNKCEWRYISSQQLKQSIEQVTCCICLQTHARVELQCGHLLHCDCMRECVRLKMQCPLCRSVRIGRVRVFCGGCYKAYKCFSLKWLLHERCEQHMLCQNCRCISKEKG